MRCIQSSGRKRGKTWRCQSDAEPSKAKCRYHLDINAANQRDRRERKLSGRPAGGGEMLSVAEVRAAMKRLGVRSTYAARQSQSCAGLSSDPCRCSGQIDKGRCETCGLMGSCESCGADSEVCRWNWILGAWRASWLCGPCREKRQSRANHNRSQHGNMSKLSYTYS